MIFAADLDIRSLNVRPYPTTSGGIMPLDKMQLKELLIQRLEQLGVEVHLVPGFLRLLANSVFVHSETNRFLVNQHLHYLGWEDFELDEQAYQLAIACFEAEGLSSGRVVPPLWFEHCFNLEQNCVSV
jgi:hypothetical protein